MPSFKTLKCKINLIPFNPYPGSLFQRPSQDRIEAFQSFLINKHYTSMVRYSKGLDILAACGQLRTATERGQRISSQQDGHVQQ